MSEKKRTCFVKKVAVVLVFACVLFQLPALAAPETHQMIPVSADTFVRGGLYETTNYGDAELLEFKATGSKDYNRKVYLAFPISGVSAENLSNAVVRLNMQSCDNVAGGFAVRAFVTHPFEEHAVIYSGSPGLKRVAGVGYAVRGNKTVDIDVTQSVKDAIEDGDQVLYLALYDREQVDHRADFYSRESGNGPVLDLKYGGTPDPIPPLDDGLGFSGATVENAIENAQRILKESRAEYMGPQNEIPQVEKISDTEVYFKPTDDTYVNGGTEADKSFGTESSLRVKTAPNAPQYSRYSVLKFDVSEADASVVGGAFLKLKTTVLEGAAEQELTAFAINDNDWTEYSLTWNNAPALGAAIDAQTVKKVDRNVYFDLTSFVNEVLARGESVLSVAVKDLHTYNLQLSFGAKESADPPRLMLMDIGGEPGSVPNPSLSEPEEEADDAYDYITVGVNRNQKPYTNFTPTKTRVVSSLREFTPTTSAPEVSMYGGLLSKQYDATGFFYAKEVDGRWWLVDPLGHPMFNFALGSVTPPKSEKEIAGMQRRYGTVENWAKSIAPEFKAMGFNGAGVGDGVIAMMDEKMPYCKTVSCIGPYGYARDMVTYSGSTIFKDDVMPVFDPQFVSYVDKKAQTLAKYKDDPYLIGWFSDNEISVSENMLDNYLKQDPEDDNYIYCYYTAWEWLKERYGEDASITDITARDRDDFREFVFDYYYRVVSEAFQKYDPNHMYMGSRLNGEARSSEGIFKAAGRYADVISFNYYGVWTPDLEQMANWYRWSGKPCIITECYTKGMDASERIPGLTNESGAGWIVPTQTDRGYFYQNYALALLESKTCVGWHWYKYQDNDPDMLSSDPSNLNSNKGIVDRDFNDYPELIEKMRELNFNAYAIIDYFDSKNGSDAWEDGTCTRTVSNSADTPISCVMLLALCDQAGNLLSIDFGTPVEIAPGGQASVSASVSDKTLLSGAHHAKAFLWDSANMLKPFEKASEYAIN